MPNPLLIGDGVNSRLATFEDIYDVLVHGPCASDAGPVKYPTVNWWRLSYERDAACKMHKDYLPSDKSLTGRMRTTAPA